MSDLQNCLADVFGIELREPPAPTVAIMPPLEEYDSSLTNEELWRLAIIGVVEW